MACDIQNKDIYNEKIGKYNEQKRSRFMMLPKKKIDIQYAIWIIFEVFLWIAEVQKPKTPLIKSIKTRVKIGYWMDVFESCIVKDVKLGRSLCTSVYNKNIRGTTKVSWRNPTTKEQLQPTKADMKKKRFFAVSRTISVICTTLYE